MRQLETRVYVLDLIGIGTKDHTKMTQEEFMDECENQGRVFSLEGFQNAFNQEEINTSTDIVKFFHVETTDHLYGRNVALGSSETEINGIPVVKLN